LPGSRGGRGCTPDNEYGTLYGAGMRCFGSRSSLKKGIPMYSVNDKVVYPGHGVARINRIIEKRVGERVATFYELKFLNKGMTVLIPTDNAAGIGIRPLSTSQEIDEILKKLTTPVKIRPDYGIPSNWNRRNKEYQFKLRTGKLTDISEIYRDLKYIAQYKELSFGEKTLLNQTELLLAEEISAVQRLEEEKAVEYLRAMFVMLHKEGQHNITL
jgi:CarD family transcriptional regulator